MEEFFQTLRQIQKKERNNGSLARVGDNFYKRVNSYINELKATVGPDPFSDKQYLLKDAQRIATEICERREHKITEAALINIHRSYHLFKKGKPQFDLLDTTPLNLTEEEETLYFSLIDNFKTHRGNISLDKFSEDLENNVDSQIDEENGSKSSDKIEKKNNLFNEEKNDSLNSVSSNNEDKDNIEDDEVLNDLNKIKKAKVITDEKYEPIEKQIQDSKVKHVKNFDSKNNKVSSESNAQDESDLSDILNDVDNQFVDFDEEEEYPHFVKDSFSANNSSENDTVLIFKNVEPIIGVDEKIYGPFYPQDVVVMPKDNAEILIKYRKARLVKIS